MSLYNSKRHQNAFESSHGWLTYTDKQTEHLLQPNVYRTQSSHSNITRIHFYMTKHQQRQLQHRQELKNSENKKVYLSRLFERKDQDLVLWFVEALVWFVEALVFDLVSVLRHMFAQVVSGLCPFQLPDGTVDRRSEHRGWIFLVPFLLSKSIPVFHVPEIRQMSNSVDVLQPAAHDE